MNVSALHSSLGPYGLSGVSGFGQSPFGGLPPFGSISVNIGLAPPPPLLLPYGSSGAVETGISLKDQSGGRVSVGIGTDETGNRVYTASLGTSRGGIITFQSTRPSDLVSTTRPSTQTALPSLSDSAGNRVPYSVRYDQSGGAVLQIRLSDASGQSMSFYSSVDSLGYPTGHSPTALLAA